MDSGASYVPNTSSKGETVNGAAEKSRKTPQHTPKRSYRYSFLDQKSVDADEIKVATVDTPQSRKSGPHLACFVSCVQRKNLMSSDEANQTMPAETGLMRSEHGEQSGVGASELVLM